MEPVRRAVIDVGTNSVKLLVAEVLDLEVRPLREESKQTRLGQGFYETHRLQPGPIEKTADAVFRFAEAARQDGAGSIRVIATSAARDAVNGAELSTAVERSSGLPVEIISGEQEADLAFQGVSTDPNLAHTPLLILDCGGGSTQVILGHEGRKDFCRSFAIGSVRLMEQFSHGDPPSPEELTDCHNRVEQFVENNMRRCLEAALRQERAAAPGEPRIQFVGTGGTASILGCMEAKLDHFDRDRLEATRLKAERLNWHVNNLWSLPLEERKKITGLPSNRADVILMGSLIYETVARLFGFGDLRISTRGLRFAALLDASAGRHPDNLG